LLLQFWTEVLHAMLKKWPGCKINFEGFREYSLDSISTASFLRTPQSLQVDASAIM